MFRRKTQEIENLRDEIENLQYEIKWAKRYRDSAVSVRKEVERTNSELRSLNEKLYNAIDKKNEKIRALYYKFENPNANLVIPVPGEFKESK